MKRLTIAIVLALVALAACGQTVYYKSQATLEWDAVTTDSGGAPLLPGDMVVYQVYIYDYTIGVANPQNIALLTYIGETEALEQLIVFPYRTTWAAGVRTKLTDSGGTVSYSALAWSYITADAAVATGPFLYSPKGTPTKPPALRDSGM